MEAMLIAASDLVALLSPSRIEALADRVKNETADPDSQLEQVWNLTVGRNPTANELSICRTTLQQHGLITVCRALFNSNEFLFVP